MHAIGYVTWETFIRLAFIINVHIVCFSESTVNISLRGMKYIIADNGMQENTSAFLQQHNQQNTAEINANLKSEEPFILELIKKIKSYDTNRTLHLKPSQEHPVINNIPVLDIEETDVTDRVSNLVNNKRRPARQTEESQLCRKLPLIINFREIQQKWVHSPKEYNAYYCDGECKYGQIQSGSTNHAQFQSSLHFWNPKKGRDPCCVPTKLSDLEIVYYVGRIAKTETMKDMIVEECGCR